MKIAKRDSTKYMSNKQEKRVAKDMGGKLQLASGSLWFAPSDVRLDEFLVECKTTANSYYSLTLKTWEKIVKESLNDGMRVPMMQIDLEDGKDKMYVMDINDYQTYQMDLIQEPLYTLDTEKKSIRIVRGEIKEVVNVNIPIYNVYSVQFKRYGKTLVVVEYDDFKRLMEVEK